ncbi:putative DNA binding domain-containing protein [Magnetovirga frankeli]|nr:putative DNA binding domain-containing protein [gamma proteobacterium SS-5]
MLADDLGRLIVAGEDSFTQFKENIFEAKKLAEELAAFSNAEGGLILLGVADNREVKGLEDGDIDRLNQLVSNAANENVKPPVYPLVQTLVFEGKKLLAIGVRKGQARPYATSSGLYLTKSGADKRKMSPEELKRLFAESGGLSADESPVAGTNIQDLNTELLYEFLLKRDSHSYEELRAERVALQTLCENLDLIKQGQLTLAGNLLFGKSPQRFSKPFTVQAAYFDGTDLGCDRYLSKDTFSGTLPNLFKQSLNFINSNLRHRQNSDQFNSPGLPEIPEICLTEALINALIHRDYFINASIKLFLFHDRLEIISPGKLVNSLTVEKIRQGLAIHRNPILNSLGQYLLPYSGLGSGIRRIERHCPEVRFVNDSHKEEFRYIFPRGFARAKVVDPLEHTRSLSDLGCSYCAGGKNGPELF